MSNYQYKISDIPKWLQALVIGALLIAALLIALYFSNFHGSLSSDQGVWGQFGDYVGGILNPLFALTALFALLYTIMLQSKELRDSSEQLRRSAAALDAQKEILTRQTFENTFFQLLAQFNGVVRDMKITVTTSRGSQSEKFTHTNRDCIEELISFFINII